ncbi:hypothetical protein [Methylomonas methanica]|uniref:Uncharacterized protein n=1 Tax=Methylomonas methanica TaxID=421 RepID=A0A177MIK9_METMH|nr:hypothetical protein [Methylomonas methanica]OAI05284.1 hypothetical protein A1332_13655 [Methylomonas methanica]
MGRFNSVTNGRFQVSEFHDSFRAMNLKSGQSPGDPNLTVAFLQTGPSAKSRFCELEGYKAAVSDLTQLATFPPLITPKIMEIEYLLSSQNLTPTLYP